MRVSASYPITTRGYPRSVFRQRAGTRGLSFYSTRVTPMQPKIIVQGLNLIHFPLWFLQDVCALEREREHEAANEAVLADPNVMAALT